MSDDTTLVPVETAPKQEEYEVLDEGGQKDMVRASLLNLERLHLECRINLAINDPDIQMAFEDGSSMKLGDRMALLDDKLTRFKAAFKDLL